MPLYYYNARQNARQKDIKKPCNYLNKCGFDFALGLRPAHHDTHTRFFFSLVLFFSFGNVKEKKEREYYLLKSGL